jgi:hypothetical protein
MFGVFYDLETSDKNPIGQIINYSFILVDEQLNILDEISGLVKLSRLQIPEPGAILANRTDLITHQQVAEDYEPAAMLKIFKFINRCIETANGAIALVGYNSARFDLNYLRTSLIRNGFNPYFDGKIVPRDLLHVVNKGYLSSSRFREAVRNQRAGEARLSLALQSVSQALGLLEGKQAHESRADVVLTIELAKWLKCESSELDVINCEPYEALVLHSTARSGSVYLVEQPEYDLSLNAFSVKTPYTLLDANNKAGLWIDLDRYSEKQSPECIVWRSSAKHPFFISHNALNDSRLAGLARAALKQFKGITLKGFFKRSTCDVEMDIYRLERDDLGSYIGAVRENNRDLLNECVGPEAKVLWVRRVLASPKLSIADPKNEKMLRDYALYRYGGKLQLSKRLGDEEKANTAVSGSDKSSGDYHRSLLDIVHELKRSYEAAIISKNSEDEALLKSLEIFIRGSDIFRVAGGELVPHWAVGAACYGGR